MNFASGLAFFDLPTRAGGITRPAPRERLEGAADEPATRRPRDFCDGLTPPPRDRCDGAAFAPAPPRDFCVGAVFGVALPIERWLGESPPYAATRRETPEVCWAVERVVTLDPVDALRAYAMYRVSPM